MKKTYQLIISVVILLLTFVSGGYADNVLNQARIYVNPGHGGWGSNDRPMATINYAVKDTLGFFETNTNLHKGFSLRDELVKAGAGYVRMSRTVNGVVTEGDPQTTPNDTHREGDIINGVRQIVTLSVICQDVETNNMDYFLSIHSNAASEGAITNYPLLLYRGTDAAVGNGLQDAKNMALDAWKYIINNQATYYSHYTGATQTNVRGDVTFMGSSSTGALGYTGYYGVLKHGTDGFLSEGCFHTYQPERHRLLNPDYCRQEGVRYSRAIRAWFGDNTETKGSIMGTVKDKNESLEHNLYKYKVGSYDQYKPLNNVEVVLQDASGNSLKTYETDKEYNGIYVFNDLPPGIYKLVYDIEGYWPEVEEIEVVANETAFINKLLTSTEEEQPQEPEEEVHEVEYYTHPTQDGDIAGASAYTFADRGDVISIEDLEDLTVRRAILRDGKYYVLAVDADKAPHLLVINPETGELIKEMSTEGLVTDGFEGKELPFILSDIAFTNDGVLIGVNSTVVGTLNNGYQTGDFHMYKWQAASGIELEDAEPTIFLTLPTNSAESILAAGFNYSNFMANSMVISGTIDNFNFYCDTHPGNNWTTDYDVRYVIWNVQDGKIKDVQYNNTGWSVLSIGQDVKLTLSPLAIDHVIIDGNNMKPRQFMIDFMGNDVLNVTNFSGDISNTSSGATYFRYAKRVYMNAPSCEKQANDTYAYSIKLFDITDGLDKAKFLGETEELITGGVAPAYMTTGAVVDNADIDLYLLADGQILNFTTKGVEQPAGAEARIFAYNLSAEYDAEDVSYVITFSLNADADAVQLILKNTTTPSVPKTINLGARAKGENSYTLDVSEFAEGDQYDWELKVSAPNITRFTKVYDKALSTLNFAGPKGVAIDKSPESPYFGRVYVTNTVAGLVSGRNTTKGIYVLSPEATDITNQGATAHTGGITWASAAGESPRKPAVAADGRLFIADASATNAGVFYMNPEDFSASSIFTGANVTNGSVKIGSTYVCGQIVALGVRGEGAGTQLYAVDKTASGSSWKKHVNIYNIGTNNTWTKAPTSSVAASSYIGNDNASIVPVSTGYWAGQYRGAGSNSSANPYMFYYSDAIKEVVFNTAEFKDQDGKNIEMGEASQNGALGVYEKEGLVALSYDNGVQFFNYTIDNDDFAQVSLKFWNSLDVSGVTYDDFAFDYAGNLYAVSYSGKFVSVWAMPTANNTSTVKARSAYSLERKENTGVRNSSTTNLSVYPNPTQSELTISSQEDIHSIQIYSLNGQLLNQLSGNSKMETIDISNMDAGVYLIRVNGKDVQRVIKQ